MNGLVVESRRVPNYSADWLVHTLVTGVRMYSLYCRPDDYFFFLYLNYRPKLGRGVCRGCARWRVIVKQWPTIDSTVLKLALSRPIAAYRSLLEFSKPLQGFKVRHQGEKKWLALDLA